jgi:hypothetical protein
MRNNVVRSIESAHWLSQGSSWFVLAVVAEDTLRAGDLR